MKNGNVQLGFKTSIIALFVAIVLVMLQRRRRSQPDVRSPDYEVGGNKYVRDPADKTRRDT